MIKHWTWLIRKTLMKALSHINLGIAVQFIVLIKLRTKMTKDLVKRVNKIKEAKPAGFTIHSIFWALGRYDVVWYVEAPDEKAVMSILMQFGDAVTTETLIAVPREEALKMLG